MCIGMGWVGETHMDGRPGKRATKQLGSGARVPVFTLSPCHVVTARRQPASPAM